MLRPIVLAVLTAVLATPVLAQTASAPAAATAPAATSPGAKPDMKIVREQCRSEVVASKLKGDARHQAMADCIIKQRPDMEARVKCAMDPSMKGLDKDAKRAAMKICVTKSKS